MEISEAMELISTLVFDADTSQRWLDLGCGTGTFTIALAELLPKDSIVIGIDQSPQKLPSQTNNGVSISFHQQDIEDKLILPDKVDGIMMANALHYIAKQKEYVQSLFRYMKSSSRVVIIEYDTDSANQWVPFPLSYSNLKQLFKNENIKIVKIGERKSSYHGSMYAAELTWEHI